MAVLGRGQVVTADIRVVHLVVSVGLRVLVHAVSGDGRVSSGWRVWLLMGCLSGGELSFPPIAVAAQRGSEGAPIKEGWRAPSPPNLRLSGWGGIFRGIEVYLTL